MSMNRAELSEVLSETTPNLQGGSIQKVYEADRNTFVLRVRASGTTRHLLVSVCPGFTRLYEVSGKPDQPPHPTAFTMQLRKWIEGARIEAIELLPGDRIVLFRLDVRDPDAEADDHERRQPTLVAELTGHHGCAYLLDEDHRIIGQSHRSRGLGDRSPGDRWSPPDTPFAPDDAIRDELQPNSHGSPISKRLATYFRHAIAEHERLERLRELRGRLKREAKRLKRRLSAVESDLAKAENADDYKRRAELLQGAYNKDIPRGADRVLVTDYWDPDMKEVELSIEPRLSLQENIDRAFHQYRRLSEATDRIEERMLGTLELIDKVAAARDRLADTMSAEELDELGDQLVADGVLPRRKRAKQQASEKRSPFRTYRAPSGAQILVGRNSRGNDELTTRVARGRDIWLHARDWAGSHVVLRMSKNDEPRGDDLLAAAMLAAHFSKGSEDTLIDVTWTRAKHVRKPKGAAPGLVTHSGGSNLAVRRDQKRLQEVLATLED